MWYDHHQYAKQHNNVNIIYHFIEESRFVQFVSSRTHAFPVVFFISYTKIFYIFLICYHLCDLKFSTDWIFLNLNPIFPNFFPNNWSEKERKRQTYSDIFRGVSRIFSFWFCIQNINENKHWVQVQRPKSIFRCINLIDDTELEKIGFYLRSSGLSVIHSDIISNTNIYVLKIKKRHTY